MVRETGASAADCVRGRAQPHSHTPPQLGASPLTCARMLVFLPPSPVCGALGADSAGLMALVRARPLFSPVARARGVPADCGIGAGAATGCFHVYCVSGTCHRGRAAHTVDMEAGGHPTRGTPDDEGDSLSLFISLSLYLSLSLRGGRPTTALPRLSPVISPAYS